jgi:hypothetical protein
LEYLQCKIILEISVKCLEAKMLEISLEYSVRTKCCQFL